MRTAIVMALVLSGCGSLTPRDRFVDASGVPANERDIVECEYEQTKAAPETAGQGWWFAGMAPPVIKRCLELRGYRDTASGAFSYK